MTLCAAPRTLAPSTSGPAWALLSHYALFTLSITSQAGGAGSGKAHQGAAGVLSFAAEERTLPQMEAQSGSDTPVSNGACKSHHLPNKGLFGPLYTNPWGKWKTKSFSEVLRWQRERKKAGINTDGHLIGIQNPTLQDYARAFPLNPVNYKALQKPQLNQIQVLWVGHATCLVQMDGFTFLTDPVFSERCAPVQWAGPKRLVPAALKGTEPELPDINFVLLSHNHYDHLDATSVRTLHKRFGTRLKWYVPLGLAAWFQSEGISQNVVEMDWWQKVTHTDSKKEASVDVTMVPAQHWGARGVMDRQRTLWGGYVVSGLAGKFYFAGDTGYAPVFKEVGERLGPIDVSTIPIGAYDPRWFMGPQHVDPEEALAVHQDVRSAVTIAIHTCTFSLTDEPLDEPPYRLSKAVAAAGLAADSFVTLQHGELAVCERSKGLVNSPKLLGTGPDPRDKPSQSQ